MNFVVRMLKGSETFSTIKDCNYSLSAFTRLRGLTPTEDWGFKITVLYIFFLSVNP